MSSREKLPRYNRKIFIGDVHGCYDELIQLLSNIEYDSNYDQLYFVGDLVVKGPKSNEVIEFVRTHKNCYCVMGNHDYYLLTAAQHINHYPNINKLKPCKPLDDTHPAYTNIKHIQTAHTISIENLDYLQSLPLYLYANDRKQILVIHAGIIPNDNIKLESQQYADFMTLRNIEIVNNEMIGSNKIGKGKPWISYYNGFNGHVFFGHDAPKSLQIGQYATGLDTGCCYGDRLTVAIVKCNEKFKLFDDYKRRENEYNIMEWENNSDKYVSFTSPPFVYRLYSVKSKKSYEPRRGGNTSPTIKLIDQLLFVFA